MSELQLIPFSGGRGGFKGIFTKEKGVILNGFTS